MPAMEQDLTWTAFEGACRLRTGSPAEAAVAAHRALSRNAQIEVLTFDDSTGRVVDLDLRGDADAIATRYALSPKPRGRPKLGVTAREVTLLPRHWDWLAAQPGGASVALRKLVEEARRADGGAVDRRARQERAYRFMSALAGDLPGYEEAIRALFADDGARFSSLIDGWPIDVRDHAAHLAGL